MGRRRYIVLLGAHALVACSSMLGLEPLLYDAEPLDADVVTTDASPETGGGDASTDVDVVPQDADIVSDASDIPDVVEEPPPLPEDSGAPLCRGKPDCERVVFVTSAVYVGAGLGSVGGGDQRCQTSANNSPHARVGGRVFQAWLSNSIKGAKDHVVNGTQRYILPSGTVIANTRAEMLDGNLDHEINEDESGAVLSNYSTVWTGTLWNGAATTAGYCGTDWNSSMGFARVGIVGATDGSWTYYATNTFGCSTTSVKRGLYCFEY